MGGGGWLCTIVKYPFLVTDPNNFLKAPLAPKYTNFEGGARAEKMQIFVNIFQKLPKKAYLAFFKILPVAQKIWQTGIFQCFRRARKINLVDLTNKKVR